MTCEVQILHQATIPRQGIPSLSSQLPCHAVNTVAASTYRNIYRIGSVSKRLRTQTVKELNASVDSSAFTDAGRRIGAVSARGKAGPVLA